jgi:hypothetical protein
VLCDGKRKDKLWTNYKKLGSKAFEKGPKAFVLDKIRDDRHAGFWRVKWSVLNARLDHVKWLSHRN